MYVLQTATSGSFAQHHQRALDSGSRSLYYTRAYWYASYLPFTQRHREAQNTRGLETEVRRDYEYHTHGPTVELDAAQLPHAVRRQSTARTTETFVTGQTKYSNYSYPQAIPHCMHGHGRSRGTLFLVFELLNSRFFFGYVAAL